ncbi:hypothetical protein KUTeg_010748 [Tegillarca granosa]|uniref:Receptor ligand binding region domain-containing protein n=1 Tax=Tegillarca granosa TaxID=220873 RepID=A0ABQ9F1X6_TEGGR|nr:hypothetical protein KUTeg_010748 [Tegillarca granosa]
MCIVRLKQDWTSFDHVCIRSNSGFLLLSDFESFKQNSKIWVKFRLTLCNKEGRKLSLTSDSYVIDMFSMFGYHLPVLVFGLLHVGFSVKQEVRVAVMAPETPVSREFSLIKVKKAIYGGISAVESRALLPNIEFNVTLSDTACNSIKAPVSAFYLMNNGCHVFFGPVCDYSLAPVARYAPFWSIPVITAGGFAHDFVANKKIEYKTLTRVGAGFTIMSDTVLQILKFYHWRQFVILYDSNGQDSLFERFCYLASAAVVAKAKQRTANLEHNTGFDLRTSQHPYCSYFNILVDELETRFTSENMNNYRTI